MKTKFYLLLLTIFLLLLTNCKTFLQPQTKSLGFLWLNSSMYAGDFCHKENIKLLSLNSFAYLQNMENFPKNSNCHAKQEEIIKIGTKIEIVDLVHDNKLDISYLLLKIAKERGNVNFFKNNSYIFIIPKSLTSKFATKEYLNNYFSKNDPNKWLILEKEEIQKAIFNKYPIFGMNKEQLKAALGLPTNIEKMQKSSIQEEQEIWSYLEYLIIFEKKQIVKITKI